MQLSLTELIITSHTFELIRHQAGLSCLCFFLLRGSLTKSSLQILMKLVASLTMNDVSETNDSKTFSLL